MSRKSENRVVEAVAAVAVLPANAIAIPNRWAIAAAGVAIQMMLGTVYAWSFFKTPFINAHGWAPHMVGVTFALAIFFLGFSAALGGRLVDKAGTKTVASIAAVLFGAGTFLAGLANDTGNIYLLWIGYGVIGGIGNGLGYVTPVAVLLRWFPDKKGFITGLAVMGFGLGAAFMSLVAMVTIDQKTGAGLSGTFYVLGIVFLVGLLIAAQKLVNPPPGYAPRAATGKSKAIPAAESLTLGQAKSTSQLYILWIILFLNVAAGIAVVSNLAYMLNDMKIAGPMVVTTMILGSFCNGVGRLLWGWLSEKIGRRNIFLLIFLTQIPLFILLPNIGGYWAFTLVACYILLCYGGGFGTMPSFTADTFGPKNIGAIYGMILLAWGVAGGIGPGLMEWFYATTGQFDIALYIAAGLLTLGLLATLLYRKPKCSE
ncbi:MAG: MFS transporter [Planctomycetaceae bacterium]|nr:MAG: MFS transporter [Planctomycetaceae bacterium]